MYGFLLQAKTKSQNRKCEFALRDAEILLVLAALKGKMKKEAVHMYGATVFQFLLKTLIYIFSSTSHHDL